MTIAKKPEIEFDANELRRRMKGFAAGREPARERTVKLPPPVKPIPAKQIRAIRPGLGCTPTGFATLLNVPAVTAISWENGTRKPSGAALRLLARGQASPESAPCGVPVRDENSLGTTVRNRSLPTNPISNRC